MQQKGAHAIIHLNLTRSRKYAVARYDTSQPLYEVTALFISFF